MIVPIDARIAVPISKYTLLSFVPSHRALLGIGVGSCLLVALWVARVRRLPPSEGRVPMWIVPILSLSVLFLGLMLAQKDATFFTSWRLALGTLVSALMAFAIARGSVIAYATAVLLMAVPAATVNPVSRGLSPLLDKDSLQIAIAESRATEGGVLWMVAGSFVMPQAFKANGIPTFGGATYLPDPDRMRVLDPKGEYVDIWNRYAHIQVESLPGIEHPVFKMIDAPGLYALRLDVCSDIVQDLGVTHIAYTSQAVKTDRQCLTEIAEGPIDGLWLYRLGPKKTGPDQTASIID